MYNACDNIVVRLPQLVDKVDDENSEEKVDDETYNVQLQSSMELYIFKCFFFVIMRFLALGVWHM